MAFINDLLNIYNCKLHGCVESQKPMAIYQWTINCRLDGFTFYNKL